VHQASAPVRRAVPRAIWSWALYDWANSAFTTLVATFIYNTYFTKAMAPDEVTGTAWWSRAVAVSAVLTALLAPVLGATADRAGARKAFLAVTTGICIIATAALGLISPAMQGAAWIALVLYVIGDWAFETGYTFYNAFLPTIASNERIGRVSGYGWGFGYIGGLVCMVIALIGFVQPETPWFGLSKAEGMNIRATNLLVAVWYLLFAIPLFLFVPEQRVGRIRLDVRGAFQDLGRTMRSLGRYREVVRFLVARLIFNDGLVTIFAFGGIYAAGTFGMTIGEVTVFGIALNVAAGLGSVLFGFVDDKIGGKKTLLVTLVVLIVGTMLAVVAPDRTWLWIAGMVIGISVGPNQSASRSLMARFVPERHQSEFFGFFQFSGKATSFLGPILLGITTQLFGSQRVGVATVVAFFVIGGLLLTRVNEPAGIAAASQA